MASGLLRPLHIKNMTHTLRLAIKRFPLAVAFTGALTMTFAPLDLALGGDFLQRFIYFCISGYMLSIAVVLFAEGHDIPKATLKPLELCTLAILAVAFFIPAQLDLGHTFLFAAIALFLTVSPFAVRKANEDQLWTFVYKSAIAVLFGGLSTLILTLGLIAVFASLGYLFGLEIFSLIYIPIWKLGWFLFFPLYIMASLPRDFNDDTAACAIPAPVSFIANYLLVPLMLVYTCILYAYGLKIILQWELPRGNLAYMVMGFGAVGVLTHLAIHPLRTRGTPLLRFYDRAFYLLLPVPLLLLLAGIWTRISDYGITEPRYAVTLSFVWLAILAALKIFKTGSFHFKYAPLSLAALCLIAAYGPFSASNTALNSQWAQLESRLQAAGVLTADGTVQKSTQTVSREDRRAISSILEYLVQDRRHQNLSPWVLPLSQGFKDYDHISQQNITFNIRKLLECKPGEACAGIEYLPRHIMAAWGIGYLTEWEAREGEEKRSHLHFSIPENNPESRLMALGGYDYMIIARTAAPRDKEFLPPTLSKRDVDGYSYRLTPEGNIKLDILWKDSVKYSALLHTQKLAEDIAALDAPSIPHENAIITAKDGKLRAELRLTSIDIEKPQKDGDAVKLTNYRGWLLFSIDP